MRVNPNMVPDILNGINLTKQEENTALLELSTGLRVNNPSDDPGAAAAEVENQALTGAVDQYTQNAGSVLNMMQTANSALSASVTSITQAISLGTQGANGTITSDQRSALADQVQSIFSSVLSDANTSYNGVYLFGGTATSAAPYTADSSSSSGYTYNGDSGTNEVEIGAGYNLQTNLPGNQLFSSSGNDVLGSLNSLAAALQSGTSTDIQNATTQLQSALSYFDQQQTFYSDGMNQINAQENFLSQETVNLKTQETSLVGADPTEAATLLSQAQTDNNAILAAAAKVLPTNLLTYLQ